MNVNSNNQKSVSTAPEPVQATFRPGACTQAVGRRPAFTTGFRKIAPLLGVAACLSLSGCLSFLKPSTNTARRFVLTPLSSNSPGLASRQGPALGVGRVRLAAYLLDTSLAVRSSTNEIQYLPAALWAERLDTGFQRTLAANLGVLLPGYQVQLSSWRRQDVAAEVYVAIEQFDVDGQGRGTLIGWWRIMAPGGAKVLRAGESRLVRQGPPPDPDPSGCVATLSELLANFSRQLAQTIGEVSR